MLKITIATILTSFLLTFIAIPSIIRIARAKSLYDGNLDRKLHKGNIPRLGGVAIFAGTILSTLFWCEGTIFVELQYILFSMILVFFLGIKDDITNVVPYKKLIIQLIGAIILVHYGDIRLYSMYGLLNIYEIPITVSYILSIITIVGIINAFNLIDGINTLAASIGILVNSFFGIWMIRHGMESWAILSFSMIGALFAFLYFNKTPAKIFMGDTGSLIIGLLCSVLAIKFIEFNRQTSIVHSAPVISFAVLIIPLFDTLRVMIRRMIRGISPFTADRNHMHHMLYDLGLSHHQVTFVLIIVNIAAIFISFSLQKIRIYLHVTDYDSELLLLTVSMIYISFAFIVEFVYRRKFKKTFDA